MHLTNDGKVVAYYGEAGFTTTGKLTQAVTIAKGENAGTYAAGTIVQTMVEQPKFYYKVVPLLVEHNALGSKVRKARYYVSATPKAGFKLHPAFIENGNENEKIYLAAFEGSLWDASASAYILDDAQVADFANDMLCSIANAKPASGLNQNLTRANTRKLAQKRGSGWEQGYVATAAASQLLMLVEYATFNVQSVIGNGAVNKTDDGTTSMTENSGATVSLGNASGAVTNANGIQIVSYRGEENFWGNIWWWVDGMNEQNPSTFAEGDFGTLFVADHALLMILPQALIRTLEFARATVAVMFPLSVGRMNLIGCSFPPKRTATAAFLLVITIGTEIPAGGLLYWAVGGVAVLLRGLSIGVCIVLLLIVIGMSAGGWCMYLPKRQRKH